MTRTLLCCEGYNDQGHMDFSNGQWEEVEGVVQALIKITEPSQDFDFVTKSRKDIHNFRLQRKVISRNKAQALRLAGLAQKEDCRYIVYHRDEDNRGFEEIYGQVEELFSVAREHGYRCLAVIPMHMTESWLLADENAFQKAFSRKPTDPVLPKKPEETWGYKGDDEHPKKYIERVLKHFHKRPCTEIYVEIAKNCDVDVLKRKCPIGFGAFHKDISGIFTDLEKQGESKKS